MLEKTLKTLEFYKIIEQVEALAGSTVGKELVRELVPLTNLDQIKEAQQITSEAVKVLTESDRLPLGGIYDIRNSVKKANLNSILAPQELMEIASTVRASRLMKEFFAGFKETLTILPDWAIQLGSFPGLEREIERCFGPGGEVLDSASPKLHTLRSQSKIYQNRIREKLESIIRSSENAKYLQELIITVRQERYVIPVKQEYRSLFPGLVHDQSASGATLFIEPMAVVELGNQLRIFESQEAEEINRILSDLSGRVKEIGNAIMVSVNVLGRFDLAFAKGQYSLKINGNEPELNQTGVVELYNARHPLLKGKVVPINVSLGKKFDTLVITGPNTGGKTVALKTVGLLTLMAQAGLHIPAGPSSKTAVFESVFSDIGDEQSIEQSLSTFSSHLTQIVKIIAGAEGANCLVLLDELGAGTDPAEGAALAMSILTHLHQLKVRTIATTHYSELKAFAYKTDGIENASVEFNIETLQPTYHLLIGVPGSSQAFKIAYKLGLPEFLIKKAQSYISAEEMKIEEMLHQIETDRRKAREDRVVGEEARAKAEQYKDQYEAAMQKFNLERNELLRQAKAESKAILLEARRESENLLKKLRESPYEELPKIVNEARQHITKELSKIDEQSSPKDEEIARMIDPDLLKVGNRVKVISLNQTGMILDISGDNVLLQVGIVKVTRPVGDLEFVPEDKVKVKHAPRKSGETGLETVKNISTEISLRGMTVDEALYQLEKYLDRAILAGLNRVRVIHGKGTGALRIAVQQYLKDNPAIKSVYFAEQSEGGLGATIAELNKH